MKKRIIFFATLTIILNIIILGINSNIVIANINETENKTYSIEYDDPYDIGTTDYIRGASYNGKNYYLNEYSVYHTTDDFSESYFKIYKHNTISNTNTLIYDATSENGHVLATNVNNNKLYVLYITDYSFSAGSSKEYDTCYIIGIDLKNDKLILKQKYNSKQMDIFYTSFTVDSQQRAYLVYDYDGLQVFDKNGKEIFNKKPTEDAKETGNFIFLKGVSPNDQILFFEKMNRSTLTNYYALSIGEGMQKLNNGVFANQEEWTTYGRTFPNNWSYNPIWHFIDEEGNYAVDQYGRLAKFDYNTNSNMMCDREFLIDLKSTVEDVTYKPLYPSVAQNENIIYLLGANNNIYIINKDTLQYNQYIATGIEEYNEIFNITYMNQSLLLLKNNRGKYYVEQIKINNNNIQTIKDTLITENSTTLHTIKDIVEKYKQTSPKYDYNKSIYKTTPGWKSPYKAGSLQDEVITDTINKLNYYRWLVGVDEIGINYNKLERNQKGAVLSKANGRISHYPTKPNDMDEEFYDEAYDGCNIKYEEGDTYSGNISSGIRKPYQVIEGFVSDLNNYSLNSATGHRQSMLDPKATAMSFGQCEEYTTASVYYDDEKDVKKSEFYSFPSAGFFPNTEMKLNEYWSIYLTNAISGTARINFTYKGETYSGTNLMFENGYPVLNFKMPSKLQKIINSENTNIPGGTEIQVELVGLKDENLNNITYRYTVNFFDMKSEMPSSQEVANLIFDYKFYADKYPDLKQAFGYNETALKNHWLTNGIKEGRQSSAVFDLKYYVYNNEDIKKAFGTNYNSAYNHFITIGFSELRPSSNEYYGKYYKNNNSDLKNFSAYNLMKHYMRFGKKEGRKATNVIDKTPIDITPYLLDYNIYISYKNNKDLKTAYGNNQTALKNHWKTFGIREGRIASIVFDAKYYLNKYPDLKKAFGNNYEKAYEHFIENGINEGRQGSRYFDVKYYLTTYKDIKNVYGENYTKALKHFVTKGIGEGRVGSAEFNLKNYKANYKDLVKAYGNVHIEYYLHYMNFGINEGRKPV